MRPVSVMLSLLMLFVADVAAAKTIDGSDRSDRLIVYFGVLPAAMARDAIADHIAPSNGHGTRAHPWRTPITLSLRCLPRPLAGESPLPRCALGMCRNAVWHRPRNWFRCYWARHFHTAIALSCPRAVTIGLRSKSVGGTQGNHSHLPMTTSTTTDESCRAPQDPSFDWK